MDLVHAASTVCFLALIGPLVLEKLERIKTKYHLDKKSGCAPGAAGFFLSF